MVSPTHPLRGMHEGCIRSILRMHTTYCVSPDTHPLRGVTMRTSSRGSVMRRYPRCIPLQTPNERVHVPYLHTLHMIHGVCIRTGIWGHAIYHVQHVVYVLPHLYTPHYGGCGMLPLMEAFRSLDTSGDVITSMHTSRDTSLDGITTITEYLQIPRMMWCAWRACTPWYLLYGVPHCTHTIPNTLLMMVWRWCACRECVGGEEVCI